MHQPPPLAPLDARLAGVLGRARRAVAWERLWPLVLPPLTVAGLFLALALFDVLPRLPGFIHALVLAAFTAAIAMLGWRAVRRFRRPTAEDAARRVERDSGLDHRPLAALADRIAAGADDPLSRALWETHRRRMAERAAHLHVAWPEPGLARRDPHALRFVVPLLLVIAATVAGSDWERRLDRALVPSLDLPSLGPDLVEVWVTPPAYTGAAPVLLKPGMPAGDPISVPAGSAVLAVVDGGWGTARLVIDGAETAFQRQADGQQRIETRVEAGHGLAVTQGGRTVGRWPLQVLADAMPSAGFALPPESGERGRVRFSVTASDDYGLMRVWVAIHRIEDPEGDSLVVELPVSGARPRSAELAAWHDLTAHPWAGLPVSARPMAADGLGQEGGGEPFTFTLPERTFTHPVARRLIEQRRAVTEDPAYAPEAVRALDTVTADPAVIDGDVAVFLALRTARHALARPALDLPEIQDLLWNAAVRLEDGDFAGAERALDDARNALRQALEEGAPADMIDRLLTEFQQALARYLDVLAQRLADQGPAPQPLSPGTRVVTDDELAQMLDSMRGMNEAGARDALKRMMDDLDQMLSGLQNAGPPPGPAMEAMRGLGDLARRQQELLDQSFRQSQAPRDAARDNAAAGRNAGDRQDALRRALGEVTRQLEEGLGAVPAPLADADQAMGTAGEALRRGDWDGAAEAQGQALQMLQEGGREAMAAMGMGVGMGSLPRDPMGRPMGGSGAGDDGATRVPAASEIQRAREILDELRRRAGQSRPEPERDYLKRLLKQF